MNNSPCAELQNEIKQALYKFKDQPYANSIFNMFLTGVVTHFYFNHQLSGAFCANCIKSIIERIYRPESVAILTEMGISSNSGFINILYQLSNQLPNVGGVFQSKIFEVIPGIYNRFLFKHLLVSLGTERLKNG